ncbi:TPA: hypothetical protein QFV26_002407 [Enterococcus faecium]
MTKPIRAQKKLLEEKEKQIQVEKKEINTTEITLNQREEECEKTEQRQLAIDKQQAQKEQDLNIREQELDREVNRKVNLKFNRKQRKLDDREDKITKIIKNSAIIGAIIGSIILIFSAFMLHKANAIAAPKKAELASISSVRKENKELKASISASESEKAQASSQAAAQKASESQAQAKSEASLKEQSDNDAQVGQLKKDVEELADGFIPEYNMQNLSSEEVQRLKANFTRERYNQLLSELEQMKKDKKIGFTDYSDIRFRLSQINGELKDQGK